MLTTLQRKLVRDLGRMKGQVITIALVVACGIASYVAMRTTWRALLRSQDAYYTRYRFADVFCALKRAPDPVVRDLEQIPGVARAYPRVVGDVMIPIEGMAEPAGGRLISLPDDGPPPLNDVYLREGRPPDPFRSDEALVLESFARAHRLRPGDSLTAVVNGRRRALRITGVALSPEYVFSVGAGATLVIDDRRFAVLWMPRRALAPLMQMEGAFNDVSLTLQPGTDVRAVQAGLDGILARYGGLGAQARARQPSHLLLAGTLTRLQATGLIVPLIFLSVAAFLVNVVLSRIVAVQRSQIAALKALGYRNREVAVHYLSLCATIVSIGALLGVALGAWLGRSMVRLYTNFFHFPTFVFRLDADIVATAVVISVGSALVGAYVTMRGVARLPPAEAMRPASPEVFSGGWLDRIGVVAVLPFAVRMVLREAGRRPGRLLLSALGIAFAVSILVYGRFMGDAVQGLQDTLFQVAQQEDLSVTFTVPVEERAARSLAHLPGVWRVEPSLAVPVRIHAGDRRRAAAAGPVFRDCALLGHAPDEQLRAVVEWPVRRVPLPPEGVVLTSILGEILGVRPGDVIEVERLDGEHRRYRVAVAGLADELAGLQGHMTLPALWRLLGEPPTVSGAQLEVEPGATFQVEQRLKDLPGVRGVSRRESAIEQFRSQTAQSLLVMNLIMTLFAAAIAVGVIYNNARIALEVKSRDLASLRVLGFTRGEIAAILLGELGLQVALALPLGLYLGRGLTWLSSQGRDPETFRMPVVIAPSTYLFAAATALVIAAGSALLVRRQLNALDLIGVLKTRE